MATRRNFLAGLAAVTLPPLPPVFKRRPKRLESPKGSEHTVSLKKHRLTVSLVQAPVKSVPMLETARAAVIPNVAGASTLTIEHFGSSATISWTGGSPPFKVESSPDLKTWTTIAGPTMQRSITVPANGVNNNYRVVSSLIMSSSISRIGGVTVYTWATPTL